GYSPERINPGDKEHRLENIVKVVSGHDKESLDIIASIYELIIEAGVFKASSIKVAEAAKVIENSQRDLNIAFVNELSIIFDKMGIDTLEVLEAAGTKWNFLNFRPGLVGGHCIGVDPYYLTYKSEMLGYKPEVILSGRRINDNMGKHIAEKTVKKLIECDTRIKGAKVLVMGLTFKENCSDLRNSKVIDVINELKEYGIDVHVYDPIVESINAMHEYGIELSRLDDIDCLDGIVCCVAHNEFLNISVSDFEKMYCEEDKGKTFIDVKGIYEKEKFVNHFNYWRL
ncbi:MAG: nucleotide sugar dehydrogenase, partial [Acidaminobacteraceae bacterium]